MKTCAARPLSGFKVVELSTVVFGPYTGQILGDYGADVVKVESPEGDSTRYTGPSPETGMASLFLGANRNKRSVVLDLKRAEGREALLRMIDGADIFMHNIRPQKLKALTLDPDSVLSRNPKVVYAGLHGFGENGPYAGKPAYDDIIQGLSGSASLMHILTDRPAFLPTIAVDKTCSLIAAHAILAALLRRERTGVGCYVEIPMFESMVAFNLVEHHYGMHFDPVNGQAGYPRVLTPSRRPYRTRDGHVCLLPYTTAQWQSFFSFCGSLELASDPRFIDMASRTENIEALYSAAADLIAQRTTQEWLEACDRLEIPAGPINRLEDLPSDAHLRQTDFFTSVNDTGLGKIHFPGVPVAFDGKRPAIVMAPRHGEHTCEVLAEIGMSPEQIQSIVQHVPRKEAKN